MECWLTTLLGVRRVRHEDGNLAVRIADAAGPPLAAVEHDLVTLDDGRGLHVGGIRRRHLRLGHAEHGADLASQQRHQPLRLLRFAAIAPQHFHVAGVGRVAVEHGGCEQAATGLLGDMRILGDGQPGAQLLARHPQIPQPLRPGLALQLFQHRRVLPLTPVAIRVAGMHLGPEGGFDRLDVLAHERFHALQIVLTAFAEFEMHGDFPESRE